MYKKTLEDYLEAIFVLSKEKKVVRIKDISGRLNVSMPTVNSAISSLKKMGYAKHEHYGYVELTEKGRRRAKEIYKRHEFLFSFLHRILGMDEKRSETEACLMEHILSKETIERLKKFIGNVT